MFVHFMFLLIFTDSADSLTAAPMPPMMPTQTPPNDLNLTAEGDSADSLTEAPMPPMMSTQTPPNDLDLTAINLNQIPDWAFTTRTTKPEDNLPTPPNDPYATAILPDWAFTTRTTTPEDNLNGTQVCSYLDILIHLDMTQDNRLYKAIRPVKDHTKPTVVWLDVALNAILDVVEKDQKLISYLWIEMKWTNEFISWDPAKFCGIQHFSVPSEYLWKPDITIDERLEAGATLSPYVHIKHDGTVYTKKEEVVVSTCRMNVYKFPFDTQSCNITFASEIYYTDELELKAAFDKNLTIFITTMVMWGEYEWEFDNFTYIELNGTSYKAQHRIVYTVTMKRKAVLYIVNFLLPVLFFLCLDMASFLISDSSGEKLGFKVTVMLAVTVLQLILNDILPATSSRVPLIATYCCGSFALMLISLLETMLVMYLLEKDSVPQNTETDKDHNLKEDKAKDSNLKGESHGFQVILDELRDLEKNLDVFFKSNKAGGRPGYWTRMVRRINIAFSICYVITVITFLTIIFKEWNPEY